MLMLIVFVVLLVQVGTLVVLLYMNIYIQSECKFTQNIVIRNLLNMYLI